MKLMTGALIKRMEEPASDFASSACPSSRCRAGGSGSRRSPPHAAENSGWPSRCNASRGICICEEWTRVFTAIPPLKKAGGNSAAARKFFLFCLFKRKEICFAAGAFWSFGGSYLGEILLLFKLPCFPTLKFAAVTQTTSSIGNFGILRQRKEVPNHARLLLTNTSASLNPFLTIFVGESGITSQW